MRSWRAIVAFACVVCTSAGYAQSLILDEEFDTLANQLTAPLRAELAPGVNVHFVVVSSPDINAFVTDENIVFVHSGLIAKTKTASELQGVLAHELGHIAAQHVTTRAEGMKGAMVPALAGAVLGLGAAIAGAPQASAALILGGQAAGIQTILAHTQVQENEADQRALSALHQAGYSAQGMVDMFTTLRTESQLSYDAPPAWLVTHPLPATRLEKLAHATTIESPAKSEKSSQLDTTTTYHRLQAKVLALSESPATVLRRMGGPSTAERYARTIALTRQGKLAEAQAQLAPLLKAAPADPFYHELAGRIALQQSNLPEAEAAFSRALAQAPRGLLIRYQLAEVQRARGNLAAAQANYTTITRAWPIWSEPWEGLALTLGQTGKIPQSHLAMAEANYVDGDIPAAKQSLALAQTYLKKSPDAEAQAWASTLADRIKNAE